MVNTILEPQSPALLRQAIADADKLIREYDALLAEDARLRKLEQDLSLERNDIISSGAVEDEKAVARAGEILTRLQMFPARREAIEKRGVALDQEAIRVAEGVNTHTVNLYEARAARVRELTLEALNRFCTRPEHCLASVTPCTKWGIELSGIVKNFMCTGNSANRPHGAYVDSLRDQVANAARLLSLSKI